MHFAVHSCIMNWLLVYLSVANETYAQAMLTGLFEYTIDAVEKYFVNLDKTDSQ